jgi:hypothetical protein
MVVSLLVLAQTVVCDQGQIITCYDKAKYFSFRKHFEENFLPQALDGECSNVLQFLEHV